MLVLSRRPNEKILFPTLGVAVVITSVSKNVVRVGIDAPPTVAVLREEIASRAEKLATAEPKPAHHRLRNRLHTATLAVHLAQKQLNAGMAREAEGTLRDALQEYSDLDRELAAEKVNRLAPKREIRTLLVEDDCNESVLLAEFLRLHGIDVQTAHDGQAALDFLKSHERPDVILLDMRMPRCDGPTTLAAIRGDSTYDATKVFAVSGTERLEFDQANRTRGLDGWFTKPVNPVHLVDKMNQALGCN